MLFLDPGLFPGIFLEYGWGSAFGVSRPYSHVFGAQASALLQRLGAYQLVSDVGGCLELSAAHSVGALGSLGSYIVAAGYGAAVSPVLVHLRCSCIGSWEAD